MRVGEMVKVCTPTTVQVMPLVLTKPYSIAELEVVLEALTNQLAGTSSMTSVSDSSRG